MEELAAELQGRMIAIEAFMQTLLAHVAINTTDPIKFTAQIMDDVERSLRHAHREAPAEHRQIAAYSVAAFESYSQNMLRHVTKIAPTKGRN